MKSSIWVELKESWSSVYRPRHLPSYLHRNRAVHVQMLYIYQKEHLFPTHRFIISYRVTSHRIVSYLVSREPSNPRPIVLLIPLPFPSHHSTPPQPDLRAFQILWRWLRALEVAFIDDEPSDRRVARDAHDSGERVGVGRAVV